MNPNWRSVYPVLPKLVIGQNELGILINWDEIDQWMRHNCNEWHEIKARFPNLNEHPQLRLFAGAMIRAQHELQEKHVEALMKIPPMIVGPIPPWGMQ